MSWLTSPGPQGGLGLRYREGLPSSVPVHKLSLGPFLFFLFRKGVGGTWNVEHCPEQVAEQRRVSSRPPHEALSASARTGGTLHTATIASAGQGRAWPKTGVHGCPTGAKCVSGSSSIQWAGYRTTGSCENTVICPECRSSCGRESPPLALRHLADRLMTLLPRDTKG